MDQNSVNGVHISWGQVIWVPKGATLPNGQASDEAGFYHLCGGRAMDPQRYDTQAEALAACEAHQAAGAE